MTRCRVAGAYTCYGSSGYWDSTCSKGGHRHASAAVILHLGSFYESAAGKAARAKGKDWGKTDPAEAGTKEVSKVLADAAGKDIRGASGNSPIHYGGGALLPSAAPDSCHSLPLHEPMSPHCARAAAQNDNSGTYIWLDCPMLGELGKDAYYRSSSVFGYYPGESCQAKARDFVNSVRAQISYVASFNGEPNPRVWQSKMKSLAPLVLFMEYAAVGVSQRVRTVPRATLSPDRLPLCDWQEADSAVAQLAGKCVEGQCGRPTRRWQKTDDHQRGQYEVGTHTEVER